jgi:hypothetical protein
MGKTDREQLLGILKQFDRQDIRVALSDLGLGELAAAPTLAVSIPSGLQNAHVLRNWFEAVRDIALLQVLVATLTWDVIDDIDDDRVKVACKGANSHCAYEKVCVKFTNPAGAADTRCVDAGFNGQFDVNFIAKKGTKATVFCDDTELGTFNIPA